MPVSTSEAISRMQAKLAALAAAGCRGVLIYGSGRHTLKVGEALGASPVPIVGIVDDARGGRGERLWNWPILSAEESLHAGADAVVISSDGQEQRLYASRGQWFKERGLAVHCLYGGDQISTEKRDTFVDRHGRRYALIPGHRRRLKPRCDCMTSRSITEIPVPTPEQARETISTARGRVDRMARYLAMHGLSLDGKDALEVGCSEGSCSFALAAAGCRSVVGIDEPAYLLWDTDPERIDPQLSEKARRELANAQETIRRAAVEDGLGPAELFAEPRVRLRVDDLMKLRMDGSFDVLCSWQTLEHLVPPEAGFAAMHRLLRPGGFCFHEYEPFSSRTGGHTLCTLDIPWGHVRLDDADVDRYLREQRPAEYPHAIRFYRQFLNRMLMADLPVLAAGAGLHLIASTAWISREQYEDELQPEYLNDARRHYPSITLEDMTAQWVCVILRRPAQVSR